MAKELMVIILKNIVIDAQNSYIGETFAGLLVNVNMPIKIIATEFIKKRFF